MVRGVLTVIVGIHIGRHLYYVLNKQVFDYDEL